MDAAHAVFAGRQIREIYVDALGWESWQLCAAGVALWVCLPGGTLAMFPLDGAGS